MGAPTYQLNIIKGKTLSKSLLYAEDSLTYVPIVAVTNRAPLQIRCPAHGIKDGWPVRIQGVTSPAVMNTEEGKFLNARVVDANTIEFNTLDATLWGVIEETGNIVFYTPADVTGWKLRMHVRDKPNGTILLSFSSDVVDAAVGSITVDPAAATFTLGLTAAQTAALTWNGGVYDIEAIKPDGTVIEIISTSVVIVSQEITVWS